MTIGKTTIKIDEIFENVKTNSSDLTQTVLELGKALNDVPGVTQKIVTTFADFKKVKLPDDEIQNFTIAFSQLSKAEKDAVLQFLEFENAGQRTDFNDYLSDLSSGTALNASLFQQELATKSLDEQTQKLILTEAGLIDSHGKYNIISAQQALENIKATKTFNELSDAQKAEILAANADSLEKQKQQAANAGLIASNGALAVSFEVVKKALIGIGIGLAITAVTAAVSVGIKALNEYVDSLDTYKTAVESADEASSAFKEEQSNLESYRNEIKENTKQILALEEAKKNASKETAVNDNDITKLRNQNSLLQANIRLHEIQAQKEAEKANNSALEALGVQKYNTHLAEPQYTSEFSDGLHDTVTDMTREQYLKSQIAEWNQLNEKLTEAHKNYSALKNPTEEQTAAFEEQATQLKNQMSTLDDNITGVYSDLKDIYDKAADDGNDEYDELIKRSGESADAFNAWSEAAHGTSEAIEEVKESAEDTASTLESINSGIDSIQSAYKSLNSAVQEYNTYGGISLDTLQEILALDDKYVNCLVDQNGQLSLNMDTFQELAKMRLKEAEAAAVQQAIRLILFFFTFHPPAQLLSQAELPQ